MSDDMRELTIVPVSDEDRDRLGISLSDIVALYKDNKTGIINVGYPCRLGYIPMLANMYGYKDSDHKALFYDGTEVLKENAEKIIDRPIYKISVTPECTVFESKVLNGYDSELDDFLVEVEDTYQSKNNRGF